MKKDFFPVSPGDGGRKESAGAAGKPGLPEEKFSEREGGSLRGEGETLFQKGFPFPPQAGSSASPGDGEERENDGATETPQRP